MKSITVFLLKAFVVLIGLVTVAFPMPALAATLVADYQFNNTLASSMEGAPICPLWGNGTLSLQKPLMDSQSWFSTLVLLGIRAQVYSYPLLD
jgi:hypothetical protein